MTLPSETLPSGFGGITNEVLLFILFALVILFTSNALWGTVQKFIEKRKSKSEGSLDEKRMEFDISRYSIEVIQQSIITLNGDLERLRSELNDTNARLNDSQAQHLRLMEKNAALMRYIAKAVSLRRADGQDLIEVDPVDHAVIPEVVNITK